MEGKSRPLDTHLDAGKHRNGALMRCVRTDKAVCERVGWPGEYLEMEISMAGCNLHQPTGSQEYSTTCAVHDSKRAGMHK